MPKLALSLINAKVRTLAAVRITSAILAFATCIVGVACAAQTQTPTPLREMIHRAWTAREGAPRGLNDGIQGPDGFLWLTTHGGLYRFDGVSFSRYKAPHGQHLISDQMNTISVAHDGSIWVSYMLGGVSRIHGDRITNYTEKEGLRSGHTGEITEDNDGRLWIAGTRGLQYIHDGRVTQYQDASGVGDLPAEEIAADSEGNVWVATDPARIMVLGRGTKHFVAAAENGYYGCVRARDRGVLCRSETGPLTHLIFENSVVKSTPLQAPIKGLSYTHQAKDGTVWLVTDRSGLLRFDEARPPINHGMLELFGTKEGLTSDNVEVTFEDREGSVWVVTDQGLDQFRPSLFQGMNPHTLAIVLPGRENPAPFIVATDRLLDLTGAAASELTPKFTPGSPRSLCRADDGSTWIGTDSALYHYKDGNLSQITLPGPLASFHPIQTIVEDAHHNIWAAVVGSGLRVLRNGQWLPDGTMTGLPTNTAYTSLRDAKGGLWFGYRHNKLAHISSETLKMYTEGDGLAVGDVRVLTENEGLLWIGGENGISLFRNSHFAFLPTEETSSIRGVTGLTFTPDGSLWGNSESGIFFISHEQLDRWKQTPNQSVNPRFFNYLDGVSGIPMGSDWSATSALGPNGLLYFIADRQLHWLDPSRIPKNDIRPNVFVTTVAMGSEPIASSNDRFALPSGARNVEVSYTATSLLVPERVRFKYRLLGYDNGWVDAGTRRQALYAKLPAGTYTFQVIAANDSGVWNEQGASATLTVPPTFIETVWFKLALVLIISLAGVVIYRVRLEQAKRRSAERVYELFAERERIARDLHDNLLQSVTALILRFATTTKMLSPADPARQSLEATIAQSDQVLLDGRQIVLNLQSSARPVKELVDALRKIGEELLSLYPNTTFTVEDHGQDFDLNGVVFQEICALAREALTNAFRHAQADHVWLVSQHSSTEVSLTIKDDGRGIDRSILQQGHRQGHWGLPNMRERARRLGARYSLRSEASSGTVIEVTVPGSLAYLSPSTNFWSQLRSLLRTGRFTRTM